jgi:hypothetical protein
MMNSSSASLACSLYGSAFNSHCFVSTDTQNTAIREKADFQWTLLFKNYSHSPACSTVAAALKTAKVSELSDGVIGLSTYMKV